MRLQPNHGDKSSENAQMLHPYALIREKGPNTFQRERVEGIVLVGKYFRVVRRGSPAIEAFITRHENLPNKELYSTKRMVLLIPV